MEAFSRLAEEFSECPSKEKGGKLSAFMRGQMAPEFEEAAFKTKPGKMVPGIIKTEFGYHVILVEKHS